MNHRSSSDQAAVPRKALRIHCLLFTTYYPLLTLHDVIPTPRYLVFNTYHSILTMYYSQGHVRTFLW